MDKRTLHHYWRYAKLVKPWHLFLLILLFAYLSLQAYRQNSQDVIPLVSAVLEADKQGVGVDEALRELGNYMTNHMNSQISSPIRLENTFYRDYEAALRDSQPTANSEIYKQAQAVCEDPNKILSDRALCIQEYVLNNAPPGQEITDANLPSPDQYTYEFITPTWSPDRAGWLMVITLLVTTIFLSRIFAGWLVLKTLKRHL